MHENLKLFFERLKSLGFWKRVFGWKKIRTLSYDAYDEYNGLVRRVSFLEDELAGRESVVADLKAKIEREAEISLNRISDLNFQMQKQEARMQSLENELARQNREKSDLSATVARYEQADQGRTEEFIRNIAAVNAVRKGIEEDRSRLNEERIREKEEYFEKMRLTWRNHEITVKATIKNICKAHFIEYVENVPFRGNPDNTIMIAGEYVIFDAKSPAGDDLENFPRYLKVQTESVKKYTRQENVKNDIFLVVPANTLDVVSQYSFNMGDYYVYIITADSLEPIILSLKKIEDYEFAGQLTPDERDNICRIIGKFSHTAKRKIQVDNFFSFQFLEIISKAGIDLPADIMKSVVEFEKAEKLNPPQEKRSRQISADDLVASTENLALEAVRRIRNNEEDNDPVNDSAETAILSE
ncbi:MAG: hypothetical protein RBU28_03970 [Bacteroidales bacterium]|jgi:hypothetical protein|nr:hypothetical protein [Bacteroidales bacterium]